MEGIAVTIASDRQAAHTATGDRTPREDIQHA
jgi:hypothetical protein